ncbi:lipase 3-like [Onthophagus taurus]|uniref:lipase 3-like n=1 Tax=Onthophagus taurus TaxID=166361 RepID=UPI000C1FF8CB|nr:lipase 3-like [Onthophagus taurus]
MKIATFLILAFLALSNANVTKDIHPAAGLSFVDMVEFYGYPIEVHEDIQTEDGYLLTMHRIPHGKSNGDQKDKKVVLLMHCLMCSGAVYAVYGPENGLAFILADQGYDVWMPSARGTQFSKKHITLDPEDDADQFWKFSWHEIGYYDIPAFIDYIQEQTGVEKMSYLGYSQGTTTFYVLASSRPEYNDKINVAISLAPIGYMGNMTDSFLRYLSEYIDALNELLDMIGWHEFVPNYELMGPLMEWCKGSGQQLCDNIFFLIFGQTSEDMDDNWGPVFATHLPAGASSKQWVHYGQGIQSGFFRRFDFGLVGNLAEYGSVTPPKYDLGQITAPTAFLYGDKDSNANVVDVEQLLRELPNVVFEKLVEGYAHGDFIFAQDVTERVNEHVVEILNNY